MKMMMTMMMKSLGPRFYLGRLRADLNIYRYTVALYTRYIYNIYSIHNSHRMADTVPENFKQKIDSGVFRMLTENR